MLEVSPVKNDNVKGGAGNAEIAKEKRDKKPGNTRCFPGGKSFQHRPGYKAHIKNKHEGIEPQENLDQKNWDPPDDRISCRICHKKFTTELGLKGHIQRIHLGLTNEEVKNENEEDNEDGKDFGSDEDEKLEKAESKETIEKAAIKKGSDEQLQIVQKETDEAATRGSVTNLDSSGSLDSDIATEPRRSERLAERENRF